MSRILIPWLILLVSPLTLRISSFSPSTSSTRKHTRTRYSPIKQTETEVRMVQPPPSVEHIGIQKTSTQGLSPSSLSMTARTGFELPDLRNLFTLASSSTELRIGTNKQMFLQSLDTLNTLNQGSKERTQLLNKMISEKVTTKDLNNALTSGSGSGEDGIIPTASLENPGLESTFSSVAPGTWKVIYAPHITTIAGIAGGKFDVQYTCFNDGTMTSHARYNFPVIGEGYLSVSGTYGSVDNIVSRVDFDTAWVKPFVGKSSDGPYESLEDVPASPVKDIINSIGKAMFIDAVAIFPVSFLDDDTIVFDFELLGTRICAKKL